jgi:single-strand DNA-binding protein
MSTNVTLIGRVGSDPELKITANGKQLTKLSVVTSGRRLTDGNWVDVDTTWWSVVCFGTLAERVAEQVGKGMAVIVYGKARQVEWEQEGVKRYRVEITATSVGPDLQFDIPQGRKVQRSDTAPADQWQAPADDFAAPF